MTTTGSLGATFLLSDFFYIYISFRKKRTVKQKKKKRKERQGLSEAGKKKEVDDNGQYAALST